MNGALIGALGVAALLVLILVGTPIAVALMAIGFIGLVSVIGLPAALSGIANQLYVDSSNYAFSVIPFFIAMGYFASASGIVDSAYDFASKWLSNVPGGLYVVAIATCAIFAAATGSSFTGTIAVGKSILPEMEKRGYDSKLSVGCLAVAGTLGVMIPPSLSMVIYGIATNESIGTLLIAGVIPGIMSTVVYMLGSGVLVALNPRFAPRRTGFTWRERFRAVPGVWGIAVLAGIIIGGIYSGIFTPTEAGAIAAVVALILLAYGRKNQFFTEFRQGAKDTIITNAMIFFILVGAMIFSRFLTRAGAVDSFVEAITKGGFAPWVILALFLALWTVLGMFMAATAVLLLVAPIAHATLTPLGYDGIWLGVIMTKMFELAALTPPVALNVYVAKSLVPEMRLEDAFRGTAPFIVMECVTVALLVAFPEISLWLPRMAFG